MSVVLTLHAVRDVEEACDYYSTIDPQLSTRFVDDVDAAIERIVMFPNGAPPVDGFDGLRRARLRRFPYGVFYQKTTESDLLIVRVLHSRRHRLEPPLATKDR
ncbi:MAG: type II toxin-antitoxin system RelE/ParE family toxin [Actinomycetales bacterium]